ncbi:MAG: type II toxin-antitoxin system death-on-curing family toxin [Anaerolineales bacterium]
MNYLSAEQVLFIHARLIEETGGSHGLRDMDGLLTAVGRPRSSFEGKELYPDPFSKAAALFESLIRNHPFVDGNKRTGAAAASLFLQRNGHKLTASSDDLVDIAMGAAQSQLTVEQIASWLRDHSKPTK